jgi:hypothetical protein
VTLTASTATITSPSQTLSLTATASSTDGKAIGKIEFYEGATLLGTKNASPAQLDLTFVEGDNGPHLYTAKAYTPSSNGTSAAASVTVSIPGDPCGVNAAACVGTSCPASSCLAPSHVSSGFGSFARAKGLKDIALVANTQFNTGTGAVGTLRPPNADPTIYEVNAGIGFVQIAQGGAEPPLGIWVFKSLEFQGGLQTFVGNASAVLASAGALAVGFGATLDAGAKGKVPGAGGFVGGGYAAGGTGCAPGTGTAAGAGGGGFGTSGGNGNAAVGGAASGCSGYGDLTILRGGSGGGGADDSNSSFVGPMGGGGGGALQLTALGDLTIEGIVNAGGGGGRTSEGNWRNGAGGGSGGAIYLEAPLITLGAQAYLTANGGGGGSGSPGTGGSCGTPATSQDGLWTLTPATGSHCGGAYGGNGAAGGTAATNGTGTNPAGGGGGGSGRIVLRTFSNPLTPSISTSNISPLTSSNEYRLLKTLGQ